MATDSANRSVHNTLTAATLDTVTLTGMWPAVEVVNRATTGDGIYFTVDGSTPTVGGNDSFWVGAGQSVIVPNFEDEAEVKLISATADAYSVIGVEE